MHEDDLNDDWNFVQIHRSSIPLRWIANALGSLASNAILKISWLQENNKEYTIVYKFNSLIWNTCWPVYNKYGSYYKVDFDLK